MAKLKMFVNAIRRRRQGPIGTLNPILHAAGAAFFSCYMSDTRFFAQYSNRADDQTPTVIIKGNTIDSSYG